MKKQIAILGSTGSIGKSTLKIIDRDLDNFKILLLTTNKNFKTVLKQAVKFNVKNVIITNENSFKIAKNITKYKNINIHNNFKIYSQLFKKKIDYVMSSISGLNGLEPTLKIIRHTKTIAIANKESIICAWNLLSTEMKRFNTKFIPVDSEHFSIWSLLNNSSNIKIEKIFITASGGPFLNYKKKQFLNIKPSIAIRHPNWSMGKKISIDSSTMMNKVFEIIEAKRIFDTDLNKFEIIIHPKSYLHSIVKFNNGTAKLLIHDTNMEIPIFNSLYYLQNKNLKTNSLNFKILNNLNLQKPKSSNFPCIKFLRLIPNQISLYETVMIAANDELVKNFLDNKIRFTQIYKILGKILKIRRFKLLKSKKPQNLNQILKLSNDVRLKTQELCIR